MRIQCQFSKVWFTFINSYTKCDIVMKLKNVNKKEQNFISPIEIILEMRTSFNILSFARYLMNGIFLRIQCNQNVGWNTEVKDLSPSLNIFIINGYVILFSNVMKIKNNNFSICRPARLTFYWDDFCVNLYYLLSFRSESKLLTVTALIPELI